MHTGAVFPLKSLGRQGNFQHAPPWDFGLLIWPVRPKGVGPPSPLFVKPQTQPRLMPQEKKIAVPSATLDVSVQYRDEFLNNCVIQLFNAEGTYYSGRIDLGDAGRKSIIV